MTKTIVQRLREAPADKISWNAPVIQEAADEIERKDSLIDAQHAAQTSLHGENVRLREEVEQLRGEAEVADEQLAQLRGFAEAHKNCRGSVEPGAAQRCGYVGMYDGQCGLDAGHSGEHRLFGPHRAAQKSSVQFREVMLGGAKLMVAVESPLKSYMCQCPEGFCANEMADSGFGIVNATGSCRKRAAKRT